MPALRRVYRAVAWYAVPAHPTGFYDAHEVAVTRHFLTKRSRDSWAKQRAEGYPETAFSPGWDDVRPPIPPADRVEVADSEPVVFA